jgi:chemotaxis-related protein WspD
MNETAAASDLTLDCWKRIGIHGDRTCPELKEHVHCRNCPQYSTVVSRLLDCEPPSGYLEQWSRQLSQAQHATVRGTLPVAIFRLGAEWLALNTTVLEEMTDTRPIHRIPHRTTATLLGLVNVRGMLHLCVSLANLLNIEPVPPNGARARRAHRRLIVMHRDNDHWAFETDEVHGIERISPEDCRKPPVTNAKAVPCLIRSLFSWDGLDVGYLDDESVFGSLRRSVL